MQDHQYSFEVDASPEEVWSIFWGKKTGDVIEHGNVRIEILHGGDENGEGLIRHCHFPVPRYLLSGGVAEILGMVNTGESPPSPGVTTRWGQAPVVQSHRLDAPGGRWITTARAFIFVKPTMCLTRSCVFSWKELSTEPFQRTTTRK